MRCPTMAPSASSPWSDSLAGWIIQVVADNRFQIAEVRKYGVLAQDTFPAMKGSLADNTTAVLAVGGCTDFR